MGKISPLMLPSAEMVALEADVQLLLAVRQEAMPEADRGIRLAACLDRISRIEQWLRGGGARDVEFVAGGDHRQWGAAVAVAAHKIKRGLREIANPALDVLDSREAEQCAKQIRDAGDELRALRGMDDRDDHRPFAHRKTESPSATIEDPPRKVSGMMSIRDLAEKHRVDQQILRKALERWRLNHDDGYSEVTTRRQNEPRFLFEESAILPVIDGIKRRTETSHERPTEK